MGKPAEEGAVSEPAPVPVASEHAQWKSVDIPLISDRLQEPVQQAPVQMAPISLPDAVDLSDVIPKPANDPSALLQIIILKGNPDDVEKFKGICATHFPPGSPMAVMTTSGLPLGTVQGMLNEAQKINPHMDLSKDHILVTPRIKRSCRHCNGKGYIGRLSNTAWTPTNGQSKFHSYMVKCPCLKLEMEFERMETPAPETEQQKDSTDASTQGEKQEPAA